MHENVKMYTLQPKPNRTKELFHSQMINIEKIDVEIVSLLKIELKLPEAMIILAKNISF